jgi:hypothetical protein
MALHGQLLEATLQPKIFYGQDNAGQFGSDTAAIVG